MPVYSTALDNCCVERERQNELLIGEFYTNNHLIKHVKVIYNNFNYIIIWSMSLLVMKEDS